MTEADIKKVDKRVLLIQEPFGKGFSTFYGIFKELASRSETSVRSTLQVYLDWKIYHELSVTVKESQNPPPASPEQSLSHFRR